jgi:hypothetical protein
MRNRTRGFPTSSQGYHRRPGKRWDKEGELIVRTHQDSTERVARARKSANYDPRCKDITSSEAARLSWLHSIESYFVPDFAAAIASTLCCIRWAPRTSGAVDTEGALGLDSMRPGFNIDTFPSGVVSR